LRFIVFILLFIAACVPKPEEIKGCGSGMEFNETTKSCVAAASVTLGSSLTTLTATEDSPESFSLPDATTDSIEGTLYWFITSQPAHGTLTGCANLDVAGDLTDVGTVLRSCIYTSDSNYVGTDTFKYKICRNTAGTFGCISAISVTVTVEDDEADVPALGGPSLLNINEGSNVSFDIRVSRRTKDESDPFYLCVDVIDPDTALTAPAVTNVNEPTDPIVVNDVNCSLLGTEDDNLSTVLATFSSGTNLLPSSASKTAYIMMRLCESSTCPVTGIDGVDNDVDGETDEEDEWSSAPELASVAVVRSRVNVNNLSFSPVMATSAPPLSPKILAAEVEDAMAMITIGTDTGMGVNDKLLEPRATDADGDAITYEYVPLSFTPAHSGTLICVPGSELACTFTPTAHYSGAMSFRYRARDATNKLSSEVTVSLSFTAVNDDPVFLPSQVLAYDSATPATQVSLQEHTTLSNRTFLVGEGGGVTENNQTLRLRASTSDGTILLPSGITVKRGNTVLGTLSDTADLVLDSASIDADVTAYTLSFTPVGFVVTSSPVTITLQLSDGFATVNQDITFLGIDNLDDTPRAVTPTTFGMKSGGVSKALEFTASPGPNDWASVAGGLQKLSVTVASSNTAVVNLAASTLSTVGGGITVTKIGASCSAASCLFEIDYDGSNNPADDTMSLNLVSGIRGNTTLTFTFSDGATTNLVKTVAVGSYNFSVTFNGWGFVRASGVKTDAAGTSTAAGFVIPTWEGLTVTEGGLATTAYKIHVYRKTISDFTVYPATSLVTAGVNSNVLEQRFFTDQTYADGSGFTPGERYYLAIAVVPTLLGEPLYPSSTPDRVLEVIVPPDNMVMVHRWALNKTFCNSTGEAVDRANNYRCRNAGLGAVLDTGVWYHDAQNHLFVDNYESGCPYDVIEDVRLSAAGPVGQVHYERGTGLCMYSDGASWLPFGSAAFVADPTLSVNRLALPPLVGLTRTEAQATCTAEEPLCAGAACPAGIWAALNRELPSRRESLRANIWPPFTPTSPLSVSIVEDSANHAATIRACNTNSAPGLSFVALAGLAGDFTNDTTPSSNLSTNRTLLNSSLASRNCVSIFEIYNMVGNVGEWQADTFDCSETNATHASCEMLTPLGTAIDASTAGSNSLGVTYAFDGSLRNGPLLEKDATLALGDLFTFDIDRFYTVLGLPFIDDATVSHPQLGMPRIGTSAPPNSFAISSFTSDTYRLSWNGDTAGASTQYAMVSGGDFSNGAGAGRRRFELVQDSQTSTKIGQRCVIRVTPAP
jgi:hypothetical protein